MIDENKEKIEESKREEIKKLAEELKDMISKDDFDLEQVEKKSDELQNVMQEVGKKMYEEASKEASQNSTDSQNSDENKSEEKKDEDVKEGEVVE